mmetsp:Transcript_14026/g.32354  ORF Transcript_14026/g.32354 Transcript_14026/m.32354 type:complete len:285 (-) Transcript_14026:342-1196(-)
MVPESLAPVTIRRSCESVIPEFSLPLRPIKLRVFFASQLKDTPIGLTNMVMILIGGIIIRATLSAFVTPIDFGNSSTKKRVRAVSASAPYFSPEFPNTPATKCVKTVVAKIEQVVDATKMVVRTRVMSSFKILKVPLFPNFSSSSANSFTFQGYSVVMAISAACNSASPPNRAKNKPNNDSFSFFARGTLGAPLPPPPMAPIANETVGRTNKERVREANANHILRYCNLLLRLLLRLKIFSLSSLLFFRRSMHPKRCRTCENLAAQPKEPPFAACSFSASMLFG